MIVRRCHCETPDVPHACPEFEAAYRDQISGQGRQSGDVYGPVRRRGGRAALLVDVARWIGRAGRAVIDLVLAPVYLRDRLFVATEKVFGKIFGSLWTGIPFMFLVTVLLIYLSSLGPHSHPAKRTPRQFANPASSSSSQFADPASSSSSQFADPAKPGGQ